MARAPFIAISITRTEQVDNKLAALPEVIKDAIEEAQTRTAADFERTAKSLIRSGGGGASLRAARRAGRGISSLISLPPRSQTGRLMRSLIGKVENRFSAALEAGVFYARFLEFGTRRMGRRPFMYRAARIVRMRAVKRLVKAIREATKKLAEK